MTTTTVCFLARAFAPMLLRVAEDVAAAAPPGTRVAVMSDAPSPSPVEPVPPPGVTLMHVSDDDAAAAGFRGSCSPHPAWDKALYAFARVDRSDAFVWFLEDDVFVPSAARLLAVVREAAERGAEFAGRGPPACGMGRAALDAVDDAAREAGGLEGVLAALAAQRGLRVVAVPEFDPPEAGAGAGGPVAGRFFHPVKDAALYARLYA